MATPQDFLRSARERRLVLRLDARSDGRRFLLLLQKLLLVQHAASRGRKALQATLEEREG